MFKTILLLLIATPIMLISQVSKNVFDISKTPHSDFNFLDASLVGNNSFILNKSEPYKRGAIWYNNLIRVKDGFEITFSFKVAEGVYAGRDDGSYPGADGFALVMQTNSNNTIGVVAGCMGYHSINNAFVVEFDQYKNITEAGLEFNDPNGNHIGLQYAKNSSISPEHLPKYCLGTYNTDINSSGTVHYCKINYDAIAHTYELFLCKTSTFSAPLSSIKDFNLEDYIDLPDGKAFIGFTSGTGLAYEKHEILSWTVNSVSNDCDSSYFEYTDFKNANDIKLNGNASMDNSSVNICSNGEFYTGSVWRSQDIPVSAGFTSTWEFSIDSSDGGKYPDASEPGADGITFLIQNATNTTNAIGSYGSGIGYEGIDNALAVEIDLFTNDSYQNDDKLDPNGNHLAIMGTTPKTTLKSLHSPKYQIWSTTSIPVIKSNGTKYYAKVEYDATKKTFDAWVNETSTFGEPNIHLSNFNIKSYLSLINGTNAYVGFTSSTGSAFQNHKLHNWYFCPKTPSGINNIPADELSDADIISPNPAGSSVNITLPEGFEDFAELEIFNAIGQKVYATELFSNNTNISVSELHDGLYFVVLKSGTKTQTAKLVIKR